MVFEKVKALVMDHLNLISVTARGMAESKERSAKFLTIQAILLTYMKEVDEDLAKLGTLKDAHYARAIRDSEGKNVTEKKINVASDLEYKDIRQAYEEMEALRDWLKGHIKLFENAHILFRNISKE